MERLIVCGAPVCFFLCLGALAPARAEAKPPRVTAVSETPIVSISTDAASDPARQQTLIEMWRRQILGPDSASWTHDDVVLLQRMREAERMGAIGLLEDKLGSLRGMVAEHGTSARERGIWLTKTGFNRYLFLKSQLARKYFEDQGTDAKFVFKLRDLQGNKLFNADGMLTNAGDALYTQIMKGREVEWHDSSGLVVGNFRRMPSGAK